MTTIPKSVKTQLDTDWTGAGGAEPTYYLEEEDFRTMPPLGEDSVWIMSKSLDTDGSDVVNDTFVNEKHLLTLIVNTAKVTGGADRLKELSDEVVRILNASPITDITYQRMRGRRRELTQNQGVWVYQEVIIYDLLEQMKSSASAHGAGATGDFIVTGDIKSSTVYSHEEALMLGSANAAWVPCIYEADSVVANDYMHGSGLYSALSGSDGAKSFTLPLPTVKGSLKLYIKGIKWYQTDADADDYVTSYTVKGFKDDGGADTYNSGTTNETATGEKPSGGTSFGAEDTSAATRVLVLLDFFNSSPQELDVSYVALDCYYDT